MTTFRKGVIVVALAAAAFATPAFAASVANDTMSNVRFKGHAMKVHAMRMDNGTVIYGFTKTQMQAMGFRLYDNPKSTDGSGR